MEVTWPTRFISQLSVAQDSSAAIFAAFQAAAMVSLSSAVQSTEVSVTVVQLVISGAILSETVIVCICGVAVFPQSSDKVQVLVITKEPSQAPAVTTSVKVASKVVSQLSASLVTSPVSLTVAS